MKVLHICNDFCGSKVHSNLYRNLDGIGVSQTVFTCYRGGYPEGSNQFEAENTDFVYRPVLSTIHRFFFHEKIAKVYKELTDSVTPSDYNLVHAVTLFTDGAVAYRLYKDYGIPYVVSVRNTDINGFLAVAPHTWNLGMKVLKNAKKIIFISKAPSEKFCKHFLVKQILPEIQDKTMIQPNGIDDYWLDHINDAKPNGNHNVIYVGRFDFNKNVTRLIEAVLSLRSEIKDIRLHLVGGGGENEKKVKRLVEDHQDCLTYHGKIFDKQLLSNLYRQCSVFAMPSIHETFGLVYVEAMSQNLPVLYTRNQGIDGLFDQHVGEAVSALSKDSIRSGLKKLFGNRIWYDFKDKVDFEQFRWSKIAKVYLQVYKEAV